MVYNQNLSNLFFFSRRLFEDVGRGDFGWLKHKITLDLVFGNFGEALKSGFNLRYLSDDIWRTCF